MSRPKLPGSHSRFVNVSSLPSIPEIPLATPVEFAPTSSLPAISWRVHAELLEQLESYLSWDPLTLRLVMQCLEQEDFKISATGKVSTSSLKKFISSATDIDVSFLSNRTQVISAIYNRLQMRHTYLRELTIGSIPLSVLAKRHANCGLRSPSFDAPTVKDFVNTCLSPDQRLALMDPRSVSYTNLVQFLTEGMALPFNGF
jgi:hypothetical protein